MQFKDRRSSSQIFVVFYTLFHVSLACKGCINLDEFSFKKVLPKYEALLVKFDVAYPYGDKHDTYTKFVEELSTNEEIIVGEIGVKDYGDKENEELSKRYGVRTKEDLPAVKLFLKNNDKYIDFPKETEFNVDNLRNFLKDNTNVYIGLPGCLEEYDKLAMNFVKATDKDSILKKAEANAEKIIDKEKDQSIVNTYLLFMKKVLEHGLSFISQEQKRLSKILKDGKVNEKKKMELGQRLNILHSFSLAKDEL